MNIIAEDDGFYYAGWINQKEWTKRNEEVIYKKIKPDDEDENPKKIIIDQDKKAVRPRKHKHKNINNDIGHYKKISER